MAPSRPATTSASSHPTSTAARKKPTTEPNVKEVVFGNLLIKPWYPSFYPEELVGRTVERLYVCQWCFKYSRELMGFLGHVRLCPLRTTGPPGEEIYRKGEYSLYEIDGEDCKLYAQNLSLFAKLFLDTKSVFYDVTTFLYYLLVAHNPVPSIDSSIPASQTPSSTTPSHRPTHTSQVIGFFSKEKMSWDNNNLACILVFPPWQKHGLGQILMGASYEMSKREGRLGGPEKPLSELGGKAYSKFWAQTLARVVLGLEEGREITVKELRDETFIVVEDLVATLVGMGVLELGKAGGEGGRAKAVINKAKVREWAERHKVDLSSPVDPDAFVNADETERMSESGEH
ncbi:uncharacterized protein EI97DRAFT_401301 [Westerdykella ornata]|uniref:histone acetyltransferase n=1 Tax=Westerdykella ornata TaxID=318751 RepID=A0A6A6JF60_WESOR|nr:uncharacterized protein EI97DRAFT_401301 [Westerdykella ornata]KAF2274813.1 hypothetical protein EI97DRAFT_401301 [Westerdykella ornata]